MLFTRSVPKLVALLLLGACTQVNVAPNVVAQPVTVVAPPVATVEPIVVPVDRDTVLDLPPALASSVTIVEPPPPVVLVPPPPIVLLPPLPPLLIAPPRIGMPGAWIPVTH